MLNKVKLALQISTTDFDSELEDLIQAAVLDMGLAGVDDSSTVSTSSTDYLVQRAIISYVAYNFEMLHGSEDRAATLKKIYDEQKGMLGMATGYTTWGET